MNLIYSKKLILLVLIVSKNLFAAAPAPRLRTQVELDIQRLANEAPRIRFEHQAANNRPPNLIGMVIQGLRLVGAIAQVFPVRG